MKTRYYTCDGGCIMLGNAAARISIPNGIGDGRYRVIVTDDSNVIKNEEDRACTRARWCGKISGDAINIYSYDCLLDGELSDNILFTIRGVYNVYTIRGMVILYSKFY